MGDLKMRRWPSIRLICSAGILSGAAFSAILQFRSSSAASGEVVTWINVTPANVDLTNRLDCDNFGTTSIAADPAKPSQIYVHFDCQGVWRSTDYGVTWFGPVNIGVGGSGAKGAGGIAVARGADGQPPVLYSAGIRGTGIGFWRSMDGGVSWTRVSLP